MTIFGSQLRKLRLERGVSTTKLANEIGFSRASIYNWEAGKSNPNSFETILTIANFFHVSPDYFSNSVSVITVLKDVVLLRDEVSKLRDEVNLLRQSIKKENPHFDSFPAKARTL